MAKNKKDRKKREESLLINEKPTFPPSSRKPRRKKRHLSDEEKAAIAEAIRKKKQFAAKMLKKKKIFKSFFKINRKKYFFKRFIRHFVHIRINANNTIAALAHLSGKVRYTLSAGLLKLRSSKRSYKYIYGLILKKFFDYLYKKRIRNFVYFKIIAPKHLRRAIIKRFIKRRFRRKKTRVMVEFLRLLPFNGCRAPKARRKKRKGLRVFKA